MKTINIFKTFLLSLLLTFGLGVGAQVTTYPHTSDFEGSLGDWVNSTGDNGDFTVDANGTPSSGTGPSSAQSGSYYVFTETSPNTTWGGQIWLECRYDFSTITGANIDFWYHKYSSNGGTNGPGSLALDVFDGASWTYDVFRDDVNNADAWKNVNIDLSMYDGRPNVILSWTVYVTTPQGWQCDIALDNIVVAGAGGGTPTCATITYEQDFETGSTGMTGTSGSQSSFGLTAAAANASLLGLHLQGNTSSSWSSSYSTGALAFANSPTHIATASRDICASTDPTVTLTFDKAQTHSYNANYCWFRLTINGTPVPDIFGNIYFNSTNGPHKTCEYDLSAYAGQDFTVAWEGCMKYHYQYYNEGDNIYIDNIAITQTTGGTAPTAPGTISGNDYPNTGQTGLTYSVVADNNVTTYVWATPVGWTIASGQGTNTITVLAGSIDGDVSVYGTNTYGQSAPSTLALKSAELERTFPYASDFENEAQHSATAGNNGFRFVANGWRNVDGDDGDWRADAGGTPSSGTGPGDGSSSGQADHSPGTAAGKYLYVESTSPNFPSKEFHLWSPPFDLTVMAVPTLTFWYSMYSASGAQMALQYSVDNGTTFEPINLAFMCTTTYTNPVIYQNMGPTWRQGFVDLSSIQSQNNVMFRFLIQTGTSYDSDICLDDIKMVDAAATSVSVGENITLGSSAYSGAYGLVLDGSSAQTITPAGQNVANITINNSNGVTLNGGDLKVDGVLTLSSGVFNTSTHKVIISSSTANSLVGGSNTAYINGNLRRHLASNTDTYAFPIGNGTGTANYQKVDLINGSLTGVTYIDASTADMTGGSNLELSPANAQWNGTVLLEVYDKNWTLTPDVQPSGGTFGVNLYLNGLGGGTIADDEFTILKRPTGSTTYAAWDAFNSTTTIPQAGAPGRTIASGYMRKDGFTSFSDFGGGGGGGGPLPIVLTSWGAEIIGSSASLEWTVESQVNNDFYTLHKSLDAEQWEEVARIPGAGTVNQTMHYQIFDENPYVGQSYYRLMQTDYDGRFEIFNMVGVFWDKPIALSINPNPVEEVLTLYLSETLRGVTHVTIFNTRGQRIYGKSFVGNWRVLELDVNEYKKGYYLLDVDHNHRKGTLKFIKE
jgi:hypothetical protein